MSDVFPIDLLVGGLLLATGGGAFLALAVLDFIDDLREARALRRYRLGVRSTSRAQGASPSMQARKPGPQGAKRRASWGRVERGRWRS